MFEKAARQKLRFSTPKGPVTVEDLWDLPLTSQRGHPNLNDIARELHKQLNSGDMISFVEEAKKSDEVVQLKLDIVKHVIAVRLAEQKAAAKAREDAEKRQRILGIIASKEDEALAALSLDELKKMVEA